MERSRRLSSSGLGTEGSTTRRPLRTCQRRSNRWRPSMESTIYEPPVALVTRAADAQFQPHERDSGPRSEEHTSELQSRLHLVCRLLLEKKKKNSKHRYRFNAALSCKK